MSGAMLEFATPLAFLLLPIPLLVYYLTPAFRSALTAVRVPYFERLRALSAQKPSASGAVLQRQRWVLTVDSLGWLLLVCAAAQPQWVGAPVVQEKTARDLMLALDLSDSMSTADFSDGDGQTVERLLIAKQVLNAFAAQRSGDRLGLIVFGDAAYLQVPFTDDLRTWSTLLDESDVGMAGQSTALGDAIGLAASLFQASETDNRVLVLLTDGNDTGSRVPPEDAARVAQALGVTIYAIGVGDPETLGEEALNLETLDALSERTGGRSFMALDQQALEGAYAEIDRLEPARYERLSFRPRSSRFHYPLTALVLLYGAAYGLAFALKNRQKRVAHA